MFVSRVSIIFTKSEKYGLFKLGMIKAIKFEVLFDKDLAMLFGS